MRSSEKCFFSLRHDLECLIIGIISFILNLFLLVSAVLPSQFILKHHGLSVIDTQFNNVYITALVILLVTATLGVLAALALVAGVMKSLPGLLVCYFSHGIALVLLVQLGALLELLLGFWAIALVQFLVSTVYIHFIAVVHSTYELMLRGDSFGSQEPLILEHKDQV